MICRPIFYFHGFNSSPNTDKVAKLKKVFSDVYAFEIDPDPAVSVPFLKSKISAVLPKYPGVKPIFVGTSLGGWYASELAGDFSATVVAINPAYAPHQTLKKLGLEPKFCDRYHTMAFPEECAYFIGKEDDVIDFSPIRDRLSDLGAIWVDGAGHRFNGVEFDAVISFLKTLTQAV